MSSESNGILYIIRDPYSDDWFDLITPADALLLVEDGMYRQFSQLPRGACCYALRSDAEARNQTYVPTEITLIDHNESVLLSLSYQQMIRL